MDTRDQRKDIHFPSRVLLVVSVLRYHRPPRAIFTAPSWLADKIPSGNAAIMVTSKTSGKGIMVERSMYWNNRGVGTDTIGGYGD